MTRQMNSWLRFLPVAVLLGGTSILVQARNQKEILPPHEDLALFPFEVGDWEGTNQPLASDILGVLGPGEFLSRNYQRSPKEPAVNLFVAYFPSQRTGDTIHSPKNCLPGSGWTPVESGRMRLTTAGGNAILVNRYVVAQGINRQLVLYWYQAHGRVVASEYWAKLYLVTDAIQMGRTDGALVRLSTPLAFGGDGYRAQERATRFAAQILPFLDSYIPR